VTTDGWDWLKDQPRSWEAPERLRNPTGSVHLNLGVQIIGSNIIGNDVVEVAAEYMAEHSRLELWIGGHKPPLTLRRKFEIAQVTSEGLRLAYEAWVAFETAYQASGRKVDQVRDERERLKAALREATEALVRARSDEVG
jgi:serine phosphatase RsbU (regulator of sigma subunit)